MKHKHQTTLKVGSPRSLNKLLRAMDQPHWKVQWNAGSTSVELSHNNISTPRQLIRALPPRGWSINVSHWRDQ